MSSERAPSTKRSELLKPHYPALDGLRAIAFFSVFALHYVTLVSSARIFTWGWVGVELFFVLSGFLITGILFDSLGKSHFFSDFYARRSLRIFPLYFTFWLVILLLTPVLHFTWNRYLLAQALYIGNFFYAGAALGWHPWPAFLDYPSLRHAGGMSHLHLGHFWSLCIEEQFYLAWPLVVWLIRSRRALLRLCLSVIIVLPVIRYAYGVSHPLMVSSGALYVETPFRVDSLLVGAALALWLRGSSMKPVAIRRRAVAVGAAAPALLAILYHFEKVKASSSTVDFTVCVIGFTLISLTAAALLLCSIDEQTVVYRMLRNPTLASIGKISYGLYFFHSIPIFFFGNNVPKLASWHIAWLMPVIAFAFTFAFAKLSYRYLETPFLRLKVYFVHNATAVDRVASLHGDMRRLSYEAKERQHPRPN